MDNKFYYKYKIDEMFNISKIVTIHYQKLDKDYVSFTESHDFWEIYYCDKNSFFSSIGGEKKLLCKGEMMFIRPNEVHGVIGNGEKNANLFIISFECKSKTMSYFCGKHLTVPNELRFLLSSIITEGRETFVIPEFNPYMDRLCLRENPRIGGTQVIKNNLEELLIKLIRTETEKPTSKEVFVLMSDRSQNITDIIISLLEESLYGRISLADVCNTLHYSKTYVCRFFKEKTGKTIIDYYLILKTEESKRLIRENFSFSQIAEKLCFNSLPHYTKTFKKYTKMTPREYKNSIL